MPNLRPNTVDSHIISFHWPLISLTLFNAPSNSPADFPRSTAIDSEDILYFHIYFLLSIFLCWCSSGCPLESRLPGCPRLLPGRAHRSYATEASYNTIFTPDKIYPLDRDLSTGQRFIHLSYNRHLDNMFFIPLTKN